MILREEKRITTVLIKNFKQNVPRSLLFMFSNALYETIISFAAVYISSFFYILHAVLWFLPVVIGSIFFS
jgi:hypothetical protein